MGKSRESWLVDFKIIDFDAHHISKALKSSSKCIYNYFSQRNMDRRINRMPDRIP